jgi:hypothetical protein
LKILELQESLQAAETLNQNITGEYNRLLQVETVHTHTHTHERERESSSSSSSGGSTTDATLLRMSTQANHKQLQDQYNALRNEYDALQELMTTQEPIPYSNDFDDSMSPKRSLPSTPTRPRIATAGRLSLSTVDSSSDVGEEALRRQVHVCCHITFTRELLNR